MAEKITITEEWDGSRLDRFVRATIPGISFPAAQEIIRKNRVLVNGSKAEGRTRLSTGDAVEIDYGAGREERGHAAGSAPFPRYDAAAAAKIGAVFGSIGNEIAVLYEDDDLMIIDKPAGLCVQPGNEKGKGSLLDLLDRYSLSGGIQRPEESTPFPFTPVHRLDRGTSGALIIAKRRPAARGLSKTIKDNLLVKIYLAVVKGVPEPPEGKISGDIITDKTTRSRSRVAPGGRKAETSYSLVKRLPGGRSLVELTMTAGRTHQIRVHLSSKGFPVEGDGQYGSASGNKRLMLHAWKMSFPHPSREGIVEATAPVPDSFNR
ncbi:MAG: RluA family pseudouridine synthase [Candidatus Krumholzibacteriota bacterium]|nr:RluA family pseudouridine synthase [Candidatus Krumholzibacteriota bacterium]